MSRRLEAKIRKEIRKRALERAHLLRQEEQNRQRTKYTLDALEEVTELPRADLESITDQVRLSHQMAHDDFFSIKNQILITLGVCTFLLIISGFM